VEGRKQNIFTNLYETEAALTHGFWRGEDSPAARPLACIQP
jgi:hypothetical protein